jgi:hypothetical protein
MISLHEEGERIVDMWRNVRFSHSCIRTICGNAGRVMGSVKSGTNVFV